MSTKIYAVRIIAGIGENATQQVRLIRAKSRASAMNFVASAHIVASVPTQDELVELGASGIKVEDSAVTATDPAP